MPMYHEDPVQAGPRLGIHPSVAIEIDWVLSAAHRPGKSNQPVLEDLYRHQPHLAERVLGLWGPSEQLSYPGYLELSVLAHQAGLLFGTDSEALFDRFDQAALKAPRDLPLLAETPEDRVVLLRRLEILRTSAARRREYLAVIREVWAAVTPVWDGLGRRSVDAAVTTRRVALEKQRLSWREAVDTTSCVTPTLERVMDVLEPTVDLVVVPAYFSRKGLIIDLPGLVIIGVQAQAAATESRARTELLAKRLKAISDSTRLAMLDALGRRELTITELTEMFGLAQPTVSNHVKLLRDAGVVVNGTNGTRRQLVVQRTVVEEMLDGLREIVGAGQLERG
jgi:ArsR family transcriptional regulator